ncbi:MAG: hypothetical protein H6981_05660 [Gammaproteobacteria bacterium]|nr:hypothetical protein [Gammaproteobacteria bacterium]MCP5136270.1 hypothetical protein [Gammaproteobacteria bacterium]
MKLRSDIRINRKHYPAGSEISWFRVYPFFLVHMLIFGVTGFVLAYSDQDIPLPVLYVHSGIAFFAYLLFYLKFFGRDAVSWMFINGTLGLIGIYTQIDWILTLFGRSWSDYPWYVHAVPVMYFVLYTFLMRQAILDLSNARTDRRRDRFAGVFHVALSLGLYAVL